MACPMSSKPSLFLMVILVFQLRYIFMCLYLSVSRNQLVKQVNVELNSRRGEASLKTLCPIASALRVYLKSNQQNFESFLNSQTLVKFEYIAILKYYIVQFLFYFNIGITGRFDKLKWLLLIIIYKIINNFHEKTYWVKQNC